MSEPAAATPERLERLTSLRGFAALFALAFHAQEIIGGFDLRPWTNLFARGYLAVDFFFVLSGFILAHVYGAEFDAGRGRYGRFLNNRLARMYPVHVLTLIAAVVIGIPLANLLRAPELSDVSPALIYNLLLLHGWGLADELSFNFPSWSISSEWFAYLCFPLLLAATRPVARRPLLGVTLALAAICALGLFVAAIGGAGLEIAGTTLKTSAPPHQPFDLTIKWSLLRVTLEFVAGLLLFRVYATWTGPGPRWLDFGVLACALALLLGLHWRWASPVVDDTVAVLLTALGTLFLAKNRGRLGSLLEKKALIYLGEISYSIYMTHALVLLLYMRLHRVIPRTHDLAGGSLVFAAFLAATLLGSVLSYELVEKPARNLLRRFSEARFRAVRREPAETERAP